MITCKNCGNEVKHYPSGWRHVEGIEPPMTPNMEICGKPEPNHVEKLQGYDSTYDTRHHVDSVRENLSEIIRLLYIRAIDHDSSKLLEPEKTTYDTLVPKLKEFPYGSEGYEQTLKEMKPALQVHFNANRHHPEHFENGINGMTLIDIVEMLADWAAASTRSDTTLQNGMHINKKRFDISDQLFEILQNTVRELHW